MIHRYAILLLVLLFVPVTAGAQDQTGLLVDTLVAQAESTSLSVPLPLAQQDATTIDTHDLSKKVGGIALLALIVLIIIAAMRKKKPKQ